MGKTIILLSELPFPPPPVPEFCAYDEIFTEGKIKNSKDINNSISFTISMYIKQIEIDKFWGVFAK